MTSLYANESIVCDGVTSVTSLYANESVMCDREVNDITVR